MNAADSLLAASYLRITTVESSASETYTFKAQVQCLLCTVSWFVLSPGERENQRPTRCLSKAIHAHTNKILSSFKWLCALAALKSNSFLNGKQPCDVCSREHHLIWLKWHCSTLLPLLPTALNGRSHEHRCSCLYLYIILLHYKLITQFARHLRWNWFPNYSVSFHPFPDMRWSLLMIPPASQKLTYCLFVRKPISCGVMH